MSMNLRWQPTMPHFAKALSLEFSISQCAEVLELLNHIEPEKLNTKEKEMLKELKSGLAHQLTAWKNAIDYLAPKPPAPLVPPTSIVPPPLNEPLLDEKLLQSAQRVTVTYKMTDMVEVNRVIKQRNPEQ